MAALSEDAIGKALEGLPGWAVNDAGEIEKEFRFDTFPAAVEFVNRVAGKAEAADHHPDIDIRYNKVRLALRTHSADAITDKDVALAGEAERLA